MKPEKFSFDFQTIEEAAQAVPSQNDRGRLDSSRLSRLPKLPQRKPFNLPDIAPSKAKSVCVNCKVRLDEYNQPLKNVNACRKCVSTFTVIETELDSADKRKRQELLKRFAEVKR